MSDSRVEKLAKVLVHYSIHVKKGDWVRIEGAAVAQELIRAAYIEVLKAGGNPMTRVGLPRIAYDFFTHASDDQLKFISPTSEMEIDRLDASLSIWAGWNSKELSGVDPKKMADVLPQLQAMGFTESNIQALSVDVGAICTK